MKAKFIPHFLRFTPVLSLISYLALHSVFSCIHPLALFLIFEKGEDGSTTHTYPGDTHANLSRLKANLSWLIRKSAGN
jgi:hypothetical protein